MKRKRSKKLWLGLIFFLLSLIVLVPYMLRTRLAYGEEEQGQGDSVSYLSSMSDKEVEELLKEGGTYTAEELEALGGKIRSNSADQIPADRFAYYVDISNVDQDETYELSDRHVTDEQQKEIRTYNVSSGLLKNNVLQSLVCKDHPNSVHRYENAVVGGMTVYCAGVLTIYDSNHNGTDYIYYSNDPNMEVGSLTAYSILKPSEKIRLNYGRVHDIPIEYVIVNEDGGEVDQSQFNMDEVFGEDRPEIVRYSRSFSVEASIPRGYTAKVEITDQAGGTLKTEWLGIQPEYEDAVEYGSGDLYVKGTTTSQKEIELSKVVSLDSVKTGNLKVTLTYQVIPSYTFSMKEVLVGRHFKNEDSNTERWELPEGATDSDTFTGHTYTWRLDNKVNETWGANYINEIDSFAINGTKLNIAFVADNEKKGTTRSAVTELPSGTKVTMTVELGDSVSGLSGGKLGYRRYYTFTVENCYENIYVTGGNMISHTHREFIPELLQGVTAAYWWPKDKAHSKVLSQSTPVATHDGSAYNDDVQGGFYFDRQWEVKINILPGYRTDLKPVVEIWTKDGVERTKTLKIGERLAPDNTWRFQIANPKNFAELKDCRMLLIKIKSEPIRFAIRYEAGDVQQASGMPGYDPGGGDGYNIIDHAHIALSGYVPNDISPTDNGYKRKQFDSWKLVKKDGNGNVTQVGEKPIFPGEDMDLLRDVDTLIQYASYNKETDRFEITLRADWKTKETTNAEIQYKTEYYLNGKHIEAADEIADIYEGGKVIADLYSGQDATDENPYGNYSEKLQSFLAAYADPQKRWVLDEELTTKEIESVQADNNTVKIYFYTLIDIDMEKIWKDGTNRHCVRPDKLEVVLTGTYPGEDGTEHNIDSSMEQKVTISDKNGWSCEWKDLLEYYRKDERFPINWQVKEMEWKPGDSGALENGDQYEDYHAVYSVDYSDPKHWKMTLTNTWTYNLEIMKYDQATTGSQQKKPLEGAGFMLYHDQECTQPATFYYDEDLEEAATPETAITHLTGSDGKLCLYGLGEGTYYLKEARTPTGYELLKEPIKIEFTEDGKVIVSGEMVKPEGKKISISVANVMQNLSYPEAGGSGIYIFQVGGILLLAASVIMLRRNGKRRAPVRSIRYMHGNQKNNAKK